MEEENLIVNLDLVLFSCFVQGVEDKEASNFYLGKRVAYIYKVTRKIARNRTWFL